MDFDAIDCRILFELERNARITDVQLAKLVKKSKDAVRYRIRKLETSAVITGYRTWVDYAKLGYQSSTLTFQLLTLPQKRKEFIAEIKQDKRVSWIGVAEGAWNIQATYAYKTNEELFAIKNYLASKYQDLIIKIELTSVVGVYVHEKSFLLNETSAFLSFIDIVETINLDEISKGILKALYNDAKKNIAAIAAELNTSVDVIRTRLKHLEEHHVIVRYTAILDYQKIGYDLYKALVYLKSSLPHELEDLVRYAEHSDKIIHFVKQIAPWDIELIIFSKSFTEYSSFIGDFTQKFSKQIRKVETAIMSEDVVLPSSKLIFE